MTLDELEAATDPKDVNFLFCIEEARRLGVGIVEAVDIVLTRETFRERSAREMEEAFASGAIVDVFRCGDYESVVPVGERHPMGLLELVYGDIPRYWDYRKGVYVADLADL